MLGRDLLSCLSRFFRAFRVPEHLRGMQAECLPAVLLPSLMPMGAATQGCPYDYGVGVRGEVSSPILVAQPPTCGCSLLIEHNPVLEHIVYDE